MYLKHNNKYVKIAGGLIKVNAPNMYSYSRNPFNLTEMRNIADLIDEYNGNKFVFLFRHSERFKSDEDGDDDGILGDLTENGKLFASRVGDALSSKNVFTQSNTKFFGTTTYRTEETARYIGAQLFNIRTDDVEVQTSTAINAVLKPAYTSSTDWKVVAKIPESDTTEWESVSKQTCEGLIKLLDDKQFAVCVSHDLNLVPFVRWCSNDKVNFTGFTGKSGDPWLCYMAGIALIIKPDNTIVTEPIYCIEAYADGSTITEGDNGYHGIMRDKDNNGYGNILHTNK